MKEQSSKKVGNILLNLLRLLYFPGESWVSFCSVQQIIVNGFNGAISYYGVYIVISIVAPLLMTFLEVKRIRKNWNKEGINRRDLITESVMVLASPLLGFFMVFCIVCDFSIY